ncbi:MAG: acyl-CoA thioesterase [Deltaproteobacteria bacterium]|nr:acyl-CoA thioesterase [Deltaproteobacteria bacterium]
MSDAPARTPTDSRVEMTQIVLPGDTNALGTAFGGRVMQWLDVAAAVAARRHCGGVAVTASMDSMSFVHPVQLGDVLVIYASVNRAWRSSMEIGVRVEGEGGKDGQRFHAASAYLTFVAVDAQGKPRVVPPVEPATEAERRRFTEAEQRRTQRLQLRRDLGR